MRFTLSSILASIVFSGVGVYVFRRGRANQNLYLLLIAIVLFVYPMFTNSTFSDWGTGVGLCALAYYFWEE